MTSNCALYCNARRTLPATAHLAAASYGIRGHATRLPCGMRTVQLCKCRNCLANILAVVAALALLHIAPSNGSRVVRRMLRMVLGLATCTTSVEPGRM